MPHLYVKLAPLLDEQPAGKSLRVFAGKTHAQTDSAPANPDLEPRDYSVAAPVDNRFPTTVAMDRHSPRHRF